MAAEEEREAGKHCFVSLEELGEAICVMDKLVITQVEGIRFCTAVVSGRKPVALRSCWNRSRAVSLLKQYIYWKGTEGGEKYQRRLRGDRRGPGGLPYRLEGTCPRVLNRPGAKNLTAGDELDRSGGTRTRSKPRRRW